MKQLLFSAMMALTAITSQAQSSETRKFTEVSHIDVKNGVEVIFTQDNTTSLKVESDKEEFLANIVTELKGGTLKVYLREQDTDKRSLLNGEAKVYISQKLVPYFKVGTGACIKAAGKLTTDELTVKLASGAAFTADVDCRVKCTVKAVSGSFFRGRINTDAFEGHASNGATIKITGKARTSAIRCNGGAMQAGKFLSDKTDVRVINASTAFVNASHSIKADADNSSSITYYGDPADVTLSSNMYTIKRDNNKFALN